jgi:hypothetical protein
MNIVGFFQTLYRVPPWTGTKVNCENSEENKWLIGPKDHRSIIHPEAKTRFEQ